MFATSVPSQDGSRWLNCLIEDESIVFPVTVGRDRVVSDLKKEIQRERAMGILKDIDPHTLDLWKVSAIDESRCEVTWFTTTT
jgi:Crinkler effector protein N-terminal domain